MSESATVSEPRLISQEEESGAIVLEVKTILIVDDDRVNRMILKAMLRKEGFEVLLAGNGQEAVDLYHEQKPQLILMDVQMPVMNGHEATRIIKESAGEEFIPIIFLTGVTDEEELARCLDHGGDDFLTKPYNNTILRSKINALSRLRSSHIQLQWRNLELRNHQELLLQEQEVAKKVYTNIVHAGNLDAPYIAYKISPSAIFNGDMLLAALTPTGNLHVLLGDFTGHGLPATIGTMPVSDIFYSMTRNGCGLKEIIAEINIKLNRILPTGLFFAVCCYEINVSDQTLQIFCAGIPDTILVNSESGAITHIRANNLPLGILPEKSYNPKFQNFKLQPGDRIYAYSDGVVECFNPEGEQYGEDRLDRVICDVVWEKNRIQAILEDIDEFRQDADQYDDMTLLEVEVDALIQHTHGEKRESEGREVKPAGTWSFSLRLDADSLRNTDPLPLFMNILMEIQGLYEHREKIFTVLSELYSNSLDHGILGLDSKLKQTPDGFMEYYIIRDERLSELEGHFIEVDFENVPRDENSGDLKIRLLDSGTGFDVQAQRQSLEENQGNSGRGIRLVETFCESVSYSQGGREVQAVYAWGPEPGELSERA